jgi:hypothetical protein
MSDLNDANLVWYFSQQGKFPRYLDPTTGKNGQGFCAGMVVCWLLLRRAGGDFATAADRIGQITIAPSQAQGQLIQSYQLRHINSRGRDGYEDMLDAEVAKALDANVTMKMEKNGELVPDYYEVTDIQSIVNYASAQMTRRQSCLVNGELTGFFIVRFRAFGKSGHVCGIEVKGAVLGQQRFRWMDPNEGCWEFASLADFTRWFLWRYTSDALMGASYDKRIKIHQVVFPTASGFDTAALMFQSSLASVSNFFKT